MPTTRFFVAAVIVASIGSSVAQAGGPFGGRLLGGQRGVAAGGEVIVDSQVISDVTVGGGQAFVGDIDSGAMVGGIPRTYGYPDLFYNHYTQGSANATNAQMYISPVPTPPNVGHTFLTYQPFQPEEMMYWHKNRYHNYYDGGRGMNHTKVHYYAPPVRTTISNLYWNYLRLPR